MQFIDLKTQQNTIRHSVRARIDAVLEHGKFILGPEVAELEDKLAAYVGVKHCISCSDGTTALLMALMAKGVGPGDAVFTSTFTFIATAEVIALLGATPVFIDIDDTTFNISPAKLHEAVKKAANEGKAKPKGIIPVDLFGLAADYDAVNAIAKEHGLFVLEDAAQGFGGTYNGKKSGSLAEIAATSFFPAKPLGCYGDGGAVFTNDDDVAQVLRSIRVHGKGADKYDNVRIGLNGRLDTLQAAILLAKLEVFDKELEAKQRVAKRYSQALGSAVTLPTVPDGYSSAWAQYSVRSPKRDAICAALKEKGVPTTIYYPKPLHLQSAFAGLGYKEGDFSVAEEVCRTVFSLPMHAYLSEQDQRLICDVIVRAVE
ncbi:MAG: aminotransferase class I/II-fold pyridoxal phosphate-dependent enzyme [Chitinivibrionales bacterium]|nr:aminotransferase class I/II-fold pyridoxal phosphate-dependent enzyme [Chitinivibrionales bacterium]